MLRSDGCVGVKSGTDKLVVGGERGILFGAACLVRVESPFSFGWVGIV